MKRYFLGPLALLLPAAIPALAQAPTLINVSPAANALAVPRTTGVVASFSQPLTATSVTALKVFSSQRGGLRGGGTATLIGASLGFFPTAFPFMPGETVQLTVTQAAASSSGPLAVPRVQQFTAAVGGTGRGAFGAGSTAVLPGSSAPFTIVLGDVDGDGDLDAVTPNQFLNSVSILLNNGTGTFAASAANATVATGGMPQGLALGDIDGDGDLDLVTANYPDDVGNSSVRLNNGSGVFTTPAVGAEVAVRNNQRSLALADLDGDGDLDLLTGGSIRLNNGVGVFTAPATNAEITGVSSAQTAFAVADLDGDGALDMIVTGSSGIGSKVDVRFNNGAAVFAARSAMPSLIVGDNPRTLALGDVDKDGDLDLALGYIGSNAVSLFLNNGAGVFGTESLISLASSSATRSLRLGDIDGDGDLDLLTPMSIRVNNGAGGFSAPAANAEIATGNIVQAVTLGDLDGDGDLDFVAGNSGAMTTLLNQPVVLSAAAAKATPAFSLYPNPARAAVTVAALPPHAAIEVLDALGSRVATATADATGAARLALPSGTTPGVYLVRAGAQVQRLLVE